MQPRRTDGPPARARPAVPPRTRATIAVVIHVHTFGDGRPVLALHSVTGHGARWRVLADALPELRFVGVDLRGHGRSPWAPPWGLEQHVADAVGVLDALGLDRVPVVGHSFGGAIALHLARLAPHRVESLVLLDPALGLDAEHMLETAEGTRADESYPDLASARADRAQRWEGISGELVDAELVAHLVADGDRLRYRYCRSAAVAAWGEMARAAVTPAVPTLLMPAERADFVDPAWVDACRAALGDALTVTTVDAGHMLFLERPADVARAVRAFLR